MADNLYVSSTIPILGISRPNIPMFHILELSASFSRLSRAVSFAANLHISARVRMLFATPSRDILSMFILVSGAYPYSSRAIAIRFRVLLDWI